MNKLCAVVVSLMLAPYTITPLQAESIEAGTILDQNNIEALKDKTLDGKKISDLLLPSQKLMITKYRFTMKLRKNAPVSHHPLLVEATKKYSHKVQFNTETRALENHVAGIPFPEINEKDPHAGIKLAYNYMRAPWVSDVLDYNPLTNLIIDHKRGLERQLAMRYMRLMTKAMLREPHEIGSADITKYETNLFVAPEDLRGLGAVTIQYVDGRLPDVYAYIKPVRRVRRLASSAWADPLAGTDFLTDESFGMNADPRWYESFKLLGKRSILGVAHSISPGIQTQESDPKKRYPTMRFDEAPHWNYLEAWEPRDVWMVEVSAPKTHMISKKTQYYDADPYMPAMHWQEYFDRAGKLWRIQNVCVVAAKGEDGNWAIFPTIMAMFDIQREHATVLYGSKEFKENIVNPNLNDYTPNAIPRLLQ
jgi:hypothetical protein